MSPSSLWASAVLSSAAGATRNRAIRNTSCPQRRMRIAFREATSVSGTRGRRGSAGGERVDVDHRVVEVANLAAEPGSDVLRDVVTFGHGDVRDDDGQLGGQSVPDPADPY